MTDDHVVHGCPTFSGKELQLVLWAGSLAAHVIITISGTPSCLNCCHFCSMYVCMCVCVCVCIYIYIYTYIYVGKSESKIPYFIATK